MKRLIVLITIVAFAALGLVMAQRQFLTIGTASVVGIYYPVGGATAQIINQADIGLRATVEATGGSEANIVLLRDGELDMALAQSDVVYQAYHGVIRPAFEGNPVEGLRTLMGLHAEPLHLVCRADAGVESVDDLRGKRVNIGNPGSGIRFTTEQALDALGIGMDEFTAEGLTGAESVDFLRDGRIDCLFYTIGIGGAALMDVSTTMDVTFVELDTPELRALVDEFPYFAFTTVPAGTYRGQDEDINLFGVKALFVTTTNLSEENAYNIVSAILDNLDRFRDTHPALRFLEAEDFLTGLGAPLHPGAERAYQEAGMLD
jgi:TRAP transporter TAXI family solute receptor